MGEVDGETAMVVMQIMRALFDVVFLHRKQQTRNRREAQREKFEEGMAQLERHLKLQQSDRK